MENKAGNAGIPQNIADSFQKIADITMTAVKSSMENSFRSVTELNKAVSGIKPGAFTLPFLKTGGSDCCASKPDCPPHCILELARHAAPGERIIVPFGVKNTCGMQKTYRIGVRELKNLDGSMAPAQPVLNKKAVTLAPGETEMILLSLDLVHFPAGNTYAAEIVVREKEINQNICFSLVVDSYTPMPVAKPLDEKKYLLHWQSWQSHFYCEPQKANR
jgi:hypothetical protein